MVETIFGKPAFCQGFLPNYYTLAQNWHNKSTVSLAIKALLLKSNGAKPNGTSMVSLGWGTPAFPQPDRSEFRP
jgi:hypothetical protein